MQSSFNSEKQSLIKGICEHYIQSSNGKNVRLEDIASIYQPQTITQADLVLCGNYPVYGANGIIGYYDKFNHENPQILITCRGSTCGTINMSTQKSWITGNSMVINIEQHLEQVDKRFLFYYFKSISFNNMISGSGQPQIVRKPLADLIVKLPDIKEQIQKRVIIDSFANKIQTEKEMLSALNKQKAFLLSNMFI